MKKRIRTKLINRSCFMQWSLLLAMLLVWFGTLAPQQAEAAVSRIGAWAEPINNDTTTPYASTSAVTIGSGSDKRLFVALVSMDYGTLPSTSPTLTAVLGGQTMEQAAWVCAGTTTYGRCSGIFYLRNAGILAQSGGILTLTLSSGTTGTPNFVAYTATFDNVDQDNPLVDFSTNQSGATSVGTLAFGKNVAIGAGDMGVYVATTNAAYGTIGYGTNWAAAATADSGTSVGSIPAQRTVPTSAVSENISPTWTTTNIASIAVAAFNDALKTEVGEGVPAAVNSTIGTSSAATNLGAFSLGVKNGSGTDDDTITGMTVTLSGNSAQVQTVTVWDNPPTTQLATIPFVSGETWTATGLTLAAADPPSSQYMLRLTSKASVASGTYPVSGSVTAVTTSKGFEKIFADGGEAVVTIDARTPTYPTGTMTVTGATSSSISVGFPYGGDNDNDNSCVIKYGTVVGTYPNTLTPTRVGKTWVATASTLNPGSVYFFQATFSDPDTVSPATAVTGYGYTTDSSLTHSSANLGAAKWAANGGWGVGNGKYGRITCSTCHVSNPSNGNVKRIKTVIATPDSTTWGSSAAVNTPATGSIVASNSATDYGTNNTTHTTSTEVCEVCHSQTSVHKYNQTAANHYTDDCAVCHKHGSAFGKPTDCGLCHAVGTGLGGAPIVFDPAGGTVNGGSEAYGAHLKALKSETLSGATNWENQCKMCHPLHSGGSVTIPNNSAVGINYTKTGGIHLGGSATTKTTEAEICWECHAKAANNVSEWGINTDTNGAASDYNFGTISQSNWIGAIWNSANFSYKTGGILSTHTANPSALGGPASTNNHGQANPDTVAQIRCTYCHDVHNTATALIADVDNKPYLRGSWKGNPYREDGAPRDTNDYSSYTAGYGAVPRGGTGYTTLGGYQIDQNNGNPTTGWVAGGATGFAGLCELCHNSGTSDGTYAATEINALNQFGTASTDWMGTNGHANSVLGGDGTGAANVFSNTDRSATALTFGTGDGVSAGNPGMAMQQNTGGYGYSFRNPSSRSGEGWDLTPRVGGEEIHTGGSYTWGVTVTSANPTQIGYHKFSCSKCHNPHASRLPRLMITNCLDTDHNTWDTKAGVSMVPSTTTMSGNSAYPSTSNASMPFSQATSAQNCHRVRDASYANSKGAGWNKVSPWVEFP